MLQDSVRVRNTLFAGRKASDKVEPAYCQHKRTELLREGHCDTFLAPYPGPTRLIKELLYRLKIPHLITEDDGDRNGTVCRREQYCGAIYQNTVFAIHNLAAVQSNHHSTEKVDSIGITNYLSPFELAITLWDCLRSLEVPETVP